VVRPRQSAFSAESIADAMQQEFEQRGAIEPVLRFQLCMKCETRARLMELYTSDG